MTIDSAAHEAATPVPTPAVAPTLVDVSDDPMSLELEARHQHRHALKSRHSQGLSQLMVERADLRGVHALADLVDESVRWTA